MHSAFEEFNELVWYTAHSAFLDGVIWCLGPYVDDTRAYGVGRIALARLTRTAVRRWCHITD